MKAEGTKVAKYLAIQYTIVKAGQEERVVYGRRQESGDKKF